MNTLTKVIAVFLAFLLILVGISNLLSNDNQEEIVAKVGKEVISLDEYKSLYQNYSNNSSSDEEQRKLKYDLLNALVEQKLLINLTNDLDLKVGEESIKEHIKNTKYFQNERGEFDKDKFQGMLNSLHITEKEYVSKLKKILPAMMLMTSLFKDNYPITFGEKIDEQIYKHRYQNQTRVIDIIKVTRDAVKDIPEPKNQDLLDCYEKNKSSFHYPEYRTAQYISLNPEYFQDQVIISNEEVDDIIEQQALKDQRDILNLVFSTKEEAEKAQKMLIEDKKNFKQVAFEFGKIDPEEIRIKNISRDFLPQNMRDIILALKEGEVSETLTSSFGWHVIQVESIHQISDEDLIKLKAEIKSALTNQKSFEKINDFINQVNYKIYNGATIEEISNEYSLQIQNIGPVNANQNDENSDELISFIFSREKDQKSYFKSVGNAIVSAKIIEITPPKQQSFEESKLLVLELWRNKFIAEKMFEIGYRIIDQLKNNVQTNIEGVELLKEQQINRDQQNYPFSFVEEVFHTKVIGSVTQPIEHDNTIILGVLKDMHSSNGKINTIDTGKRVMISLKEQLISYLESKYKVEVNHSVIDEI